MKGEDVIVSFLASKSFKTIIVNSNKIGNGTYSLYTGGSNSDELEYGIYTDGIYTKGESVTANSSTSFNVAEIVNLFGKNRV